MYWTPLWTVGQSTEKLRGSLYQSERGGSFCFDTCVDLPAAEDQPEGV